MAFIGILALLETCLYEVPSVQAATAQSNDQRSSSDFIKSLQHELKRAGYDPGAMDGKMGPTTRAALRRFQEANNLLLTGDPDIPTLTKLLSQSPPQ